MRADRLLSILMRLQTRGRMTAQDLAEQLEVSERTIYRDLDALGIAGIPIYAERGPNGGYSLVDGYQTRLTGLTSVELRALFLSASAGPLVDLGMAHALEDALLKLSASLSDEARSSIEQTRQRFHIDSSWTPRDGWSVSMLSLIQDAIWHDRRIQLVYAQDNGQQQRFLVEPYGLVARASAWYLIGACADRHNICHPYSIYSIERILLVEPTEQSFVRPNDFDLTAYWTAYQQQDGRRKPQVHPLYPLYTHHPGSKKTNFVSKKTGNDHSPYKKKSVSLHVSQHRSNTHTFKKSHIKKTASSYSSYFAPFSERLYAA